MQWSDVSWHPSTRTLRQFAGLWLAVVGASAAWQALVRQRPTVALVLALLALLVGMAGLVRPSLVRWPYVGGMVLAFPIGWAVSMLLLAILYFGIFTPLALLFRLRGRDVLRLRRPEGAASYWTPRPTVTDPRGYFRQF
jgi:hypothetical protein